MIPNRFWVLVCCLIICMQLTPCHSSDEFPPNFKFNLYENELSIEADRIDGMKYVKNQEYYIYITLSGPQIEVAEQGCSIMIGESKIYGPDIETGPSTINISWQATDDPALYADLTVSVECPINSIDGSIDNFSAQITETLLSLPPDDPATYTYSKNSDPSILTPSLTWTEDGDIELSIKVDDSITKVEFDLDIFGGEEPSEDINSADYMKLYNVEPLLCDNTDVDRNGSHITINSSSCTMKIRIMPETIAAWASSPPKIENINVWNSAGVEIPLDDITLNLSKLLFVENAQKPIIAWHQPHHKVNRKEIEFSIAFIGDEPTPNLLDAQVELSLSGYIFNAVEDYSTIDPEKWTTIDFPEDKPLRCTPLIDNDTEHTKDLALTFSIEELFFTNDQARTHSQTGFRCVLHLPSTKINTDYVHLEIGYGEHLIPFQLYDRFFHRVDDDDTWSSGANHMPFYLHHYDSTTSDDQLPYYDTHVNSEKRLHVHLQYRSPYPLYEVDGKDPNNYVIVLIPPFGGAPANLDGLECSFESEPQPQPQPFHFSPLQSSPKNLNLSSLDKNGAFIRTPLVKRVKIPSPGLNSTQPLEFSCNFDSLEGDFTVYLGIARGYESHLNRLYMSDLFVTPPEAVSTESGDLKCVNKDALSSLYVPLNGKQVDEVDCPPYSVLFQHLPTDSWSKQSYWKSRDSENDASTEPPHCHYEISQICVVGGKPAPIYYCFNSEPLPTPPTFPSIPCELVPAERGRVPNTVCRFTTGQREFCGDDAPESIEDIIDNPRAAVDLEKGLIVLRWGYTYAIENPWAMLSVSTTIAGTKIVLASGIFMVAGSVSFKPPAVDTRHTFELSTPGLPGVFSTNEVPITITECFGDNTGIDPSTGFCSCLEGYTADIPFGFDNIYENGRNLTCSPICGNGYEWKNNKCDCPDGAFQDEYCTVINPSKYTQCYASAETKTDLEKMLQVSLDSPWATTSDCGTGYASGDNCDTCQCFPNWQHGEPNTDGDEPFIVKGMAPSPSRATNPTSSLHSSITTLSRDHTQTISHGLQPTALDSCNQCQLQESCTDEGTNPGTYWPEYCWQNTCFCFLGYHGPRCEYKMVYSTLKFRKPYDDTQPFLSQHRMKSLQTAVGKRVHLSSSEINQFRHSLVAGISRSVENRLHVFIRQATKELSVDDASGQMVVLTQIVVSLTRRVDEVDESDAPFRLSWTVANAQSDDFSDLYSAWESLQNAEENPLDHPALGSTDSVNDIYDPWCESRQLADPTIQCPKGTNDLDDPNGIPDPDDSDNGTIPNDDTGNSNTTTYIIIGVVVGVVVIAFLVLIFAIIYCKHHQKACFTPQKSHNKKSKQKNGSSSKNLASPRNTQQTGRTTMSIPETELTASAPPPSTTISTSSYLPAPVANNDPTLPPEWTQLVDQSTGKIYYSNKITMESSWDHPTQPKKSKSAYGW